jgi:hypothetical protein
MASRPLQVAKFRVSSGFGRGNWSRFPSKTQVLDRTRQQIQTTVKPLLTHIPPFHTKAMGYCGPMGFPCQKHRNLTEKSRGYEGFDCMCVLQSSRVTSKKTSVA